MDEEAGHLVQGVEDERVLPGEDGHSDGAVAQHEVGLEPDAAEAAVGGGAAGQALQQHGGVQEITEIQHEEMILDSFVGQISKIDLLWKIALTISGQYFTGEP